MQPSLKGIAEKAGRQKQYRFRDLFRMFNEDLLHYSWKELNKKAALGVDRVSYQAYEENRGKSIRELVQNLKRKRYRAKLVRRHYIPKGNGKLRPLGILAMEDKLLQYAAMLILQAIYEEDFLPSSFGYRPNRSAHDALNELQQKLWSGRYHYVVEADIKGYFDNMDHDWMIRMLEERVDDKAFLWLIQKWLKAGVLETDGKVIHPATGTPQGGIISPILANVYMHYALNLWFEKVVEADCRGAAYLCVYADDFVTAFQYKEDAERFYSDLGGRFGKFCLELSAEKTNLIRFSRHEKEKNGTFEFLGFEFRWTKSRFGKDLIRRTTSKKKYRNSIRRLKQWCKEKRSLPMNKLIEQLNTKLRGTYNYYGLPGNSASLWEFHYRMAQILYKWLNRRSQCKSYTWEGFKAMLSRYCLEKPKIIKPGNQLRLSLAAG